MADETHKLQEDPPEGSRKVIEHELERQGEAEKKSGQRGEGAGSGKSGDGNGGGSSR